MTTMPSTALWHPTIFGGINEAAISLDEVNGIGLNTDIAPTIILGTEVPRPVLLTAAEALKQTVTREAKPEKRHVYSPRERRIVRLARRARG